MKRLAEKFRASEKSVPLVIAGITLLSYGLFAAQQGFNWDDWGFMWMEYFGGPGRLYHYFLVTRPLLSYPYMLTLPIIGPNPLAWQIFAMFWRAMHAIALWWTLKLIWPQRRREIFWITLLVLVYPGFSQHSVSIAFGHYSMLFTAFWLSMGLMIVSWRSTTKWKWIAAAIALFFSAWQLLTSEYYFGLELLRPIFLWFALAEPFDTIKSRFKKTSWIYLPYFLVVVFFLYWRVYIFGFHEYHADLFDTGQPATSLVFSTLPASILNAFVTSAGRAWVTILDFSALQNFSARLLLIYLAILIGSFLFMIFYDARFSENEQSDATRNTQHATHISYLASHPSLSWILLGLFSLLTAGIPFYVTNLPVVLGAPNDRFTMPFAFGAASLVVGLIGLLRKPDHRAILLSLILVLSMGKQIQYADAFRQDWDLQKSFFWQLTWRAPALEPGTVLLSDDSAIQYSVDYSLGAPINWTYNPVNPGAQANYVYYFISTRLHHQLPDLKKNLPIKQDMYPGTFISSTDNILLFQYRPPSCLHILDPLYYKDIPSSPNSADITKDMLADGIPVLTARTEQALPLSDLSRILPDVQPGAQPPSAIFGPEPAHDWCYYFQTADLARQQGDWERVAKIGDKAFAIPYYPKDASEFLPFIEAYLRLGRLDDARAWTRNAYKQMPVIAPALCGVWQRVAAEISLPSAFVDKVVNELPACPVQK
jgi:hypothetical protein